MVSLYTAFLLLAGAYATPMTNGANDTALLTERSSNAASASTSFWYAQMDHTGTSRGYAPDLDGDYNYPVFMEVAAGNGDGIQYAINAGTNGASRHPQWLASQPRVVYLPPGVYTIHSAINMNTDTIIMGDATNPPTLKAAPNFNGDTLVNGQDPSTGAAGELSFAVGLKNVILDTTAVGADQTFTALYWGVAQAAQLQNVKVVMPQSVNGRGHTGIRLGRGSTLGVSDVRVERGLNGIWHDGHQQALYKSIYFYQNTVAMLISGGSTISIFAPTFDTCGHGVENTGGSPWIALVDAVSINSGVTFSTTGYPSFLIENLEKDTGSDVAQGPYGTILGAQSHVDTFTYGNTVGLNPIYGQSTTTNPRPSELAPNGRYPVLAAPNFASNPVTDFINVKDPAQNGGRTVLGDNTRDESGVLNQILKMAADNNKIVYFPFGKYRVDDTLFIPPGSRIVGEAWATITGNGDNFKDENHPRPVVAVGNGGDVGIAQIQDMRFTVSDVLPGAIIVQFNMAGNAPGDVALWNSLVTVGGTRGADALAGACGNPWAQCKAAFLGIHMAPTSSPYVDNVWNWVADHISENFNGGTNIAGKGGVLVESTKGAWLHALGSEHWWLYQLHIRNAQKVMVSLLQSETNYDQGDHTPQIPPAPWVADVVNWADPDFRWCAGGDTRCRMGLANYINGGADIFTYASASWVFFGGNRGPCAGTYACQNYLHWIEAMPNNLQAFGLCSKDTWAAIHFPDGTDIVTQNGFTGSWAPGGGDIARVRL
ncbi:glycoside hydrolase family 55 protein [Xylaria nigripes]|nr:glycoside hydrolase family 55 protein [Xylaria nigripes]